MKDTDHLDRYRWDPPRGKIEPGVEKYSVLRSLQAIERADVSLLIVDAESGITAQDTHIAGFYPGCLEERGGTGQ